MPSRQRHRSSSLPPAPMAYRLQDKLGIHMARPNKPHHQNGPAADFDKVSVGSSLSDDMVDEEEIFVHLNARAMAALPNRLQKVMQEIQAERYERLKKENPNLRVMPPDYWIRPVEPVHRRKPISYNRAPTPLYFALPPTANKRNETANAGARANPTIQSLGPGHCYRWVAHPAAVEDSLQARQGQTASNGRHKNHSAQPLHSYPHPTKDFQVVSGSRQPMPPNLVVNQKHGKLVKTRRGSGLRSLSVKPVASNLRDRLKRSFSRLNKWMKNEI